MNKRIFTQTDPIYDLLPERGWLREYVDLTSGLEACTRFQFFTGCSILGAAINNKVYIHRGDSDLLPPLFPNPWVLLLAPPGRGHKTSTINLGVNILQEACPECRLVADKITPESLVKALAAPVGKERIRIGPSDATGLIKAPELSVFFGKQTYNVGLVQLITDLYDWRPEWKSSTIARGEIVLRNNCISVLGGSTPDWLQSMLPQDAFEGGFLPRYIIVEMPPTYFRRRYAPKKPKGLSKDSVVKNLRALSTLEGEMKWSEKGLNYYKEYYENLKPTGDVQHDAYMERSVEQVIRIAMQLGICSGRLELKSEDMETAKKLYDFLLIETDPRIERLATNPHMSLTQTLLDLLRQHEEMPKELILEKVFRQLTRGESQFNEAIRILLMTGKITRIGSPTDPVYRIKEAKL
jgi:hypothetical protein